MYGTKRARLGRGLLALTLTIAASSSAVAAVNADDYRGGWETWGAQGTHVYEFSIRGDRVRGIYCGPCSDATTLAFVDGTLGPKGLRFTVTHVRDDGSTRWIDHASGRFEQGELIVVGQSGAPGGDPFQWRLRKDPRGPAAAPGTSVNKLPAGPAVPGLKMTTQLGIPAPTRRAPPPYVAPGPWVTLTPDRVAGVWLGFGAGINKQFFIIRRVGHGLRGMVCGRCDNPYTMAALDDFRLAGDTLYFNILHEDWGPGSLPSHNQVTAHIAENEMRISTELNNTRSHHLTGFELQASLLGPVSIEATRGNGAGSD